MVFDPKNPTAGRGDDPLKPTDPGTKPPETPTKPPEGPVGTNPPETEPKQPPVDIDPPDKPGGDPPLNEELKEKLVKRKIFQRVVVDNQAPLHMCNMVARGMTVKEATAKIVE